MKKAIVVWVAGFLILVPAGIYHMFFKAEGTQILLGGFVIAFWLFGYWTCVLPLYKLYRIRKLYRAISTPEDQQNFIKNPETLDVVANTISSNVGVPKPIAEKIVGLASCHMQEQTIPGASGKPLDLSKTMDSKDMEEAAVGVISKDLGVPRFIAVKVYKFLGIKLAANDNSFPSKRMSG